jgi:hypothetical protein
MTPFYARYGDEKSWRRVLVIDFVGDDSGDYYSRTRAVVVNGSGEIESLPLIDLWVERAGRDWPADVGDAFVLETRVPA